MLWGTYLEGPVCLELTHLTPTLEDLDLSSTWLGKIGRWSQREGFLSLLFPKFSHKLSSFPSGIYEIAKSKWSKDLVIIFHKKEMVMEELTLLKLNKAK